MKQWLTTLMLLSGLLVVACRGPAEPTPTATGPAGSETTPTLIVSGSTPTPTTVEGMAKKLTVVASTSVFAGMVQSVGGDLVEVSAVMLPGVDPHTYQPTPRDVAKLADAQVVVYNGGDLDPWMERQLEAVGFRGTVVVLSEGLEPPPGVAKEEEHVEATPEPVHEHATPATQEHDHDHDHEHGTPEATAVNNEEHHDHMHEHGVNPHFWLDPNFGIIYIERIANALAEADPAHAEIYRANAARYIDEIRNFDAWAKEQIATIPPERRKLVTFHDAFPYFAAHYGLELVGVVVLSPGREPSPQEVAQLVARIRAEGVPAIFVEPQFNPKLTQTIAQEAGVRVLELYSDAAPARMDYLAMMRQNVTNVVEGLRG